MQIGSIKWKRLLRDGAKRMGTEIDPEKSDQITIHAEALLFWARKTNLTTIQDPVEVAVKHYLDSLAPAGMIPSAASLLDVGSGGGFPGIPLKILIPTLSVTLIDTSRKKVNFLKHVIRTLGLEKIQAIQGRVEDLSPDTRFDVIASRAVSGVDVFVSMAVRLLAADGLMIAFKGKDVQGEMKSVRKDIFTFDIHPYRLPYLGIERSLVIIRHSTTYQ